eukprot:740581-Alexandrium_andersonii.AAC.1
MDACQPLQATSPSPGVRCWNCAVPGTAPKFHLTRPRLGGSAPVCALHPMMTTKQAGGGAGGVLRGEGG